MTDLPLWQCHKRVRAVKLRAVEVFNDATLRGRLWPNEQGLDPIEVDAAYVDKHRPVAGGYYVRYDDGYQSFSPAEAFEEGYTRIDEEQGI